MEANAGRDTRNTFRLVLDSSFGTHNFFCKECISGTRDFLVGTHQTFILHGSLHWSRKQMQMVTYICIDNFEAPIGFPSCHGD